MKSIQKSMLNVITATVILNLWHPVNKEMFLYQKRKSNLLSLESLFFIQENILFFFYLSVVCVANFLKGFFFKQVVLFKHFFVYEQFRPRKLFANCSSNFQIIEQTNKNFPIAFVYSSKKIFARVHLWIKIQRCRQWTDHQNGQCSALKSNRYTTSLRNTNKIHP